MDTLGKVVQELDYKHFQNLKLDTGGMNLVVHAIVVVTWVSHFQDVVVSPVTILLSLVVNCKIKMNCKLAFKGIIYCK